MSENENNVGVIKGRQQNQEKGIYNLWTKEMTIPFAEDLFMSRIIGDYIVHHSEPLRKISSIKSGKTFDVDFNQLGQNPHFTSRRSGLGTIRKIVGVYNNQVWMTISHYTLVCFDLTTWEVVHKFQSYATDNGEEKLLPDEYSMQIDYRQGKIIGMRKDKLWEIPLDNPIVIMHDLTDEFKALQLETTIGFVFDNDHYYFTDHCKGYVCAIDKDSKKLVWTYRFEHVDPRNWNTALRKIHYANDHLYVSDYKGDLYIMKRDKT